MHSRQRKQEKQKPEWERACEFRKGDLWARASTVHQALAENDNPKTLPMIQRESDLELRLPPISSGRSRLRDSGCGNTCNTYGTYLDTLHHEENSGLKYSEKAKT